MTDTQPPAPAAMLREERDEWRRRAERAEALVRDLADPAPCWYDHHGGCQAHGYLSLQPGEKCPHAEAKELLATLDQDADGEGADRA